jgi:hypothetical protein
MFTVDDLNAFAVIAVQTGLSTERISNLTRYPATRSKALARKGEALRPGGFRPAQAAKLRERTVLAGCRGS